MKKEILAIIPARSGSKRIPNKNIRSFLGKPLIVYAIEQALSCDLISRVAVDTNSPKIARIAKKYGAEAPFLRPARLAGDKANIAHSLLYTLNKLKKQEGYEPDYFIILQTTSPLREIKDIEVCWKIMRTTNATTVLTVCSIDPKVYYLSENNDTILINGSERRTNNTQAWRPAYIMNGCFVYIVNTKAFLKEKRVITKRTKAVICPKWRSVDLDTIEEWVMAEVLYKNKKNIEARIRRLEKN